MRSKAKTTKKAASSNKLLQGALNLSGDISVSIITGTESNPNYKNDGTTSCNSARAAKSVSPEVLAIACKRYAEFQDYCSQLGLLVPVDWDKADPNVRNQAVDRVLADMGYPAPVVNKKLTLADITRIVYDACRSLSIMVQVDVLQEWDKADEAVRAEFATTVATYMQDSGKLASYWHDVWLKARCDDGWTHGTVADPVRKKDPLMVQYADLPMGVRGRMQLSQSIIHALWGLATPHAQGRDKKAKK